MLSETWGGAIVRDWNATLSLVIELRSSIPQARVHFEWLAGAMRNDGWQWEQGRTYRTVETSQLE